MQCINDNAQPLRSSGTGVLRRAQLQTRHPLVVESFGRLGKEGSDLIDQVVASIIGETDASSLARKGVCKERLFQIISVTTQVAISRRVHRHRQSLRDRQAARGREEEAGRLRPLAWGFNDINNVDEGLR